MASDGVWGLKDATNEWAVKTVQKAIENGADPSEYMIEEVKKFHPGDDVTIVVVVFSSGSQEDAKKRNPLNKTK